MNRNSIYILISIILVSVLLSQLDDDLSDEAKSMAARIDTNRLSDSFLYLHGIYSKNGENPVDTGRKLLEEYRKLEADKNYEVVEYPDSNKIALPKGNEFCSFSEAGCLEILFSTEVRAGELLEEHSVLVSRSNTFLEFNEYTTLSKPAVNEPLPPYNYITAAERIKVLKAISIYNNGNANKALDSLSLQFTKLRKAMALQDNLIGKLVFLAKLSEIIDVSSVIMFKAGLKSRMIPSLSQSEKSFEMIAAREFGMSYNAFLNLDKHPEFFEMGNEFPGWLARIVFKPNMTINAVAPIYYRLERLAKMTPFAFAEYIEAEEAFSPSTSKLRNYVGSILIGLSPEFDHFVAMAFDFDVKLALYNQIHHLGQNAESMSNPYYGNEIPKETGDGLCFSGPLEDERSFRCLKLKL